MTWTLTASGAEYHLSGWAAQHPDCRPVDVADIAHHLAIINRFAGATVRPYSVAEHSLFCSEIAQRHGCTLGLQMAALMHDAHEAYVGDVSSPVKQAINQHATQSGGTAAWTVLEHDNAKAVRAQFGLLSAFAGYRAVITEIDLLALATERRDLCAWDAARNAPWPVIDSAGRPGVAPVEPIDWIGLNTPERAAMSWRDWRNAFQDRYDELRFGLELTAQGLLAPADSAEVAG